MIHYGVIIMGNMTRTEFDDDINAYSDEAIAQFLKRLKTQSLDDLLKLQMDIAEKYATATEQFKAQKSEINAARYKYFALILIEIFREIWRIVVKQKPTTRIKKLNNEKSDLKKRYAEQSNKFHEELSLVYDSIEAIKNYAREITEKEGELTIIQEVIESVDKAYQGMESGDQHDVHALEAQLDTHLEERDILTNYINALYINMETLIDGLAGLFDDYLPEYAPKNVLSKQLAANKEKIAEIKQRCKESKHPILTKLSAFLSHQTEASLTALHAEMVKDKALFSNRDIGNILWDAVAIYPVISPEKNREQALLDYLELKEEELAALTEMIESTDAQLQTHENKSMRKTIDHWVQDRDALTTEMTNLLMLHRDILSGKNTDLLEKIHALAKQYSEGSKILELKHACAQIQHPVAKALQYFLTYRTDASFQTLQSVMAGDASYVESRELIRVLEGASKIDERITTESELPSIKDIQQHYINNIADKLQNLESAEDKLTDERVDLVNELVELKRQLAVMEKKYESITQLKTNTAAGYHSYLSREKLHAIQADASKYTEFLATTKDLSNVKSDIRDVEKELDVLNQKIRDVSEEKRKCVIEPVLFTPEILQNLLEKCKPGSWLRAPHPVVAALASFLKYPTPSLLAKLKLAMENAPKYQDEKQVMALLNEANRYYPYILHNTHEHAVQPRLFQFFSEHYKACSSPDDRAKEPEHKHLGPKPQ